MIRSASTKASSTVAALGTGHQVQDDFAVARGVKNGAVALQLMRSWVALVRLPL